MTEEWKDIPGYEGRYQASTLGRIRGVERKQTLTSPNGNTYTRTVKGRVLKQCIGSNGYEYVGLRKTEKSKNATFEAVHIMVAAAFLGSRPRGLLICHNDGNKTNNTVANLRYDTGRENMLDVYRCGGKCGKLTPEQAREIKKRLASGETRRSIANRFGITWQAVDAIKRGVRFSWVE